MPMKSKKERMRERNDSLMIVKADNGLVEADNVYQEFGELQSDSDAITIDIQHKIPVFKPTVLGRPPIQDRMIYYIDDEPEDAGFDPVFMFGKLKSAYNLSFSKNTQEQDQEQKHRRNMDVMFILAGTGLLVFAFFIAPLIGFSFTTGPSEETPPAPTPTPEASITIERSPWDNHPIIPV